MVHCPCWTWAEVRVVEKARSPHVMASRMLPLVNRGLQSGASDFTSLILAGKAGIMEDIKHKGFCED